MSRITAILLGCLMVMSAGAADVTLTACANADKACAIERARQHPARKLSHWRDTLARPVGERVFVGGQDIVDYITLDNIGNGYSEKPRLATVDEGFMADLRAAIAGLPANVKRLVDKKLVGIFLVEDFGGTGFTDVVVDAAGRPAAGFVLLDPSVLRPQTANGWITWRENTPFKASARESLTARIASPGENDRRRAIQYILLHELAHVISIGEKLHPGWNEPPAQVAAPGEYGYFSSTWRIADGKYVPRPEHDFAARKDVVFYFGAKLEASAMVPVYGALGKTSFATLYSSTHPGDDFAEAFANYVHVVVMKRPFAIELRRDGKLVKSYRPCWTEPRCAAKRRVLEALLG
jgi:hypothetical protein